MAKMVEEGDYELTDWEKGLEKYQEVTPLSKCTLFKRHGFVPSIDQVMDYRDYIPGIRRDFINNIVDEFFWGFISSKNNKQVEVIDKSLGPYYNYHYNREQEWWIRREGDIFQIDNGRPPKSDFELVSYHSNSLESAKYRLMFTLVAPEHMMFNRSTVLRLYDDQINKKSLEITKNFLEQAQEFTRGHTKNGFGFVPYVSTILFNTRRKILNDDLTEKNKIRKGVKNLESFFLGSN